MRERRITDKNRDKQNKGGKNKDRKRNNYKNRRHKNIKSTLSILLMIAVIASIYYLESSKVAREIMSENGNLELKEGAYPKAPELTGISGYFNSEKEPKLSDLKGKVVLIDFWTYSCINCIRTLPFLKEWDSRYRDKGLVIIGVHTPEFNFEKKPENVKAAIEKYGLKYPVVQDNEYATWQAYRNRWWPRKYLIDSEGYIRYDHIGEGGYGETEEMIQKLLSEAGADVNEGISLIEDKTPRRILTPELYAGSTFALPRGQNVGNEGGLRPGQEHDYVLPDKLSPNRIYLEGKWLSTGDNLQAKEDNASILVIFTAESVNIVTESMDNGRLIVTADGKYLTDSQTGDDAKIENGISYVEISEPRLYNPYKSKYGTHTLKLTAENSFRFNALTFG